MEPVTITALGEALATVEQGGAFVASFDWEDRVDGVWTHIGFDSFDRAAISTDDFTAVVHDLAPYMDLTDGVLTLTVPAEVTATWKPGDRFRWTVHATAEGNDLVVADGPCVILASAAYAGST